MKKPIAMLCAVLLTALAAFAPGAAAAGPALTATEAYCIIDADTGLVLAQQNMNEELHPASITKVMTLGLACEKAQGKWDNVKLTVSHEDVYSLAGTDSSHIALQEGEEVPLTDALYATMMASANDGANLLAESFGGGSIEGGVAAMNAQAKELGLEHTHFANPHGISDEDHYTSCYDMAQILRWALTQPGFETLFTRNEMYTMGPTNVQPVTRYFHQQDKMRVGSSRYYIPAILGSKIGYTNIARYSYVCLAEQNGVRLICVTMQSQIKTDKYNDVRTLLDDAFARCTGYTEIPAQGVTGELEVAGGGSTLGTVTVSDPGVKLLLADGVTAADVSVTLELPERYLLGVDPAVYAVYTIHGRDVQETANVRVPAAVTGLEELLATFSRGKLLKLGVPTVILGRPNVGKSSLLNALLGYDRAIVTDVAGTTRDTVEEKVRVGHVLLRLCDTAGIRDTADAVEKIGVDRARAAARQASLALLVLDGSRPLTEADREAMALARQVPNLLVAVNKADLPRAVDIGRLADDFDNVVSLSARSGQGVDVLCDAIQALYPAGEGRPGELLTNARQADTVSRALAAVRSAREALRTGMTPDVVLTDAETALEALGELNGKHIRDDLIQTIFSRFCVGK